MLNDGAFNADVLSSAMTTSGVQHAPDRPIGRYRTGHRLLGHQRIPAVGIGGEAAAQIPFRRACILHVVKAIGTVGQVGRTRHEERPAVGAYRQHRNAAITTRQRQTRRVACSPYRREIKPVYSIQVSNRSESWSLGVAPNTVCSFIEIWTKG